jgi:hypothetical protein
VLCLWAGGDEDVDNSGMAAIARSFFEPEDAKRAEMGLPPIERAKPSDRCRQATIFDRSAKVYIFDPKNKERLADALAKLHERDGYVHHYAVRVDPIALPAGADHA